MTFASARSPTLKRRLASSLEFVLSVGLIADAKVMDIILSLLRPLCNMDDVAVTTFLGWITPLDVPVGPGTLTLDDAEFADDDDNVTINLKNFELRDLRLTGTASCDVPIMGTIDA